MRLHCGEFVIFDAIIIGGGPAGLSAAIRFIKNETLNILLIEESDNYINIIKCGEGVWIDQFSKYFHIDESWVRLNIKRAHFISPNNKAVTFSDKDKVLGLILDRARFQEDTFNKISQKIKTIRGIKASSVKKDGNIFTVKLSNNQEFNAKTIIDASGPFSKFGRQFGIDKKRESEPAFYAIVTNIEVDTESVSLQISNEIAPGGYVWEFPIDSTTSNIGIVISEENKAFGIKKALNNYIQEKYPTGKIVSTHGGLIPSFKGGNLRATDGFFSCGDALSLVNPITRSGISEAAHSGAIAADSIILFVNGSLPIENASIKYEKRLKKEYINKIEKITKFKKDFYNIPESNFNRGAEKLLSIPIENRTMTRILGTVIVNSPKLLLAMRHLL